MVYYLKPFYGAIRIRKEIGHGWHHPEGDHAPLTKKTSLLIKNCLQPLMTETLPVSKLFSSTKPPLFTTAL